MVTKNEGTQRDGSIRAYSPLKEAASSPHLWQEVGRQRVEVSNRAGKEIEHADNCIASRSALLEIGFKDAPRAEVGA